MNTKHGKRLDGRPTDSHAAQAHGRAGNGDAHEQTRSPAARPARQPRRAGRAMRSSRRSRESCDWSLDHEGRLAAPRRRMAVASSDGCRSSSTGGTGRRLVHPGDHARVGEILDRVAAGRGLRARRRPAARRARGRVPPDVLDLRRRLGRGQHPRPRPRRTRISRAQSARGALRPPRAPQRASSPPASRSSRTRYTAVERFAGTAAHQLAEPLVIAESSAILVAEELGADLDPMLRGRLDAIGRGAARARRLMDALLADARTGGRHARRCVPSTLASVVDETLASLEPQIEERSASDRGRAAPARPGRAGAARGRAREPRRRTRSSTARAAAAAWRSRPSAVPIAGASRCRAGACRSPPRRPSASSSRSTACRASGACRASASG